VYASIYAIDGSPGSTPDPTPDATLTPGPAPVNEPSPTPPSEGFEYKFCRADRTPNKNRIMGAAKETNGSAMTAKVIHSRRCCTHFLCSARAVRGF